MALINGVPTNVRRMILAQTAAADGANTTLVTIDFGTGKGDTSTTATVSGLPWVSYVSSITASVIGPRAEDAAVEGLTLAIGDVLDGEGFTVFVSSPLGSIGTYVVACVGV